MDLATYLQGGGQVPGSGVPIQQPTLGSFQDAMRGWMMQRPQQGAGVQPWLAQRPDPHQFMAQGHMGQGMGGFQAGNIGELMAQHRNWHPGMMRAQQNSM